jgi:hypothetical protein
MANARTRTRMRREARAPDPRMVPQTVDVLAGYAVCQAVYLGGERACACSQVKSAPCTEMLRAAKAAKAVYAIDSAPGVGQIIGMLK